MPVGAGSIKRAAKVKTEGSKAARSKKTEAAVENTAEKGIEGNIEPTTEKAARKEADMPAEKRAEAKSPDKQSVTAPETGKQAVEPKRLGSDSPCQVTEEMPVFLL